jgi:hypothetical protein
MDDSTKSYKFGWPTLRARPAMYFNPVCICALQHFVLGVETGRSSAGATSPSPFTLPGDFHDWVASRLHFYGSTGGWANMIVERLGDGTHAFNRFFTLLDEHRVRVPKLVATLSGCEKTYTQFFGGQETTESFPQLISLVSYNADDPGLFVYADGDRFPGQGYCPTLGSFESWFGRCRSKLTVIDQAAVDRWSNWEPE